jgi:HlyD family secretion protein
MPRISKKALRIGLAATLVAAGGGYSLYKLVLEQSREEDEPALATAEVRLGDVVISVSGSGELVPGAEADLAFGSAGYVAEALVEAGDRVHQGDLLARLDTAELELSVADAAIKSRQADMDLSELQSSPTDADLASARMSYESALVSHQVAENGYENALNSSLDASVNSTRMQLDAAAALYWDLESNGAPASQVEAAYNDMVQTESRYGDLVRQAELEQLQAKNKLDQAADRLRDAWERLVEVQAGPGVDEIMRAQLAADRAELALADAQEALESADLRAPFDGIVLEVNALAGEHVGTGPMMTLIDMDEPLVQFWVEEADLSGVQIGYRVDIHFEALPDGVFSGEVVAVDPSLVSVGGTLAVQAWASVDVPAGQHLLGGMNAYLDVIAAEARGVLLVPVEAVRQLGEESFALFVVRPDGELELRLVDVGLYNFVYAEITSGVEMGETVSAGVQESTDATVPQFQMPGEGFIFSPGGGGGGFVVGPGGGGR